MPSVDTLVTFLICCLFGALLGQVAGLPVLQRLRGRLVKAAKHAALERDL